MLSGTEIFKFFVSDYLKITFLDVPSRELGQDNPSRLGLLFRALKLLGFKGNSSSAEILQSFHLFSFR